MRPSGLQLLADDTLVRVLKHRHDLGEQRRLELVVILLGHMEDKLLRARARRDVVQLLDADAPVALRVVVRHQVEDGAVGDQQHAYLGLALPVDLRNL